VRSNHQFLIGTALEIGDVFVLLYPATRSMGENFAHRRQSSVGLDATRDIAILLDDFPGGQAEVRLGHAGSSVSRDSMILALRPNRPIGFCARGRPTWCFSRGSCCAILTGRCARRMSCGRTVRGRSSICGRSADEVDRLPDGRGSVYDSMPICDNRYRSALRVKPNRRAAWLLLLFARCSASRIIDCS
jgi:hypothetical protein